MAIEVLDVSDLQRSPTAALFEGARAGAGISMFITRTQPGRFVELHTHPYPETFLLLEGRALWTVGDESVEVEPERMLVAPAETPHGFRNVGDRPLLVVSVHENAVVEQTDLGEEPAGHS